MKHFGRHYILPTLAILAVASILLHFDIASAQQLYLVRYYIDSPKDLEFLHAHPELDIASVCRRRTYVDIVAGERDLGILRDSGGRLKIIQSDLKAHYAARVVGPGFGAYHTYSEAIAFMDSLRSLYPNVISEKWSLGQSHEGRDLWCFRLSDNPDIDEGEPEILFDGLHHGREIMASETTLLLAGHLAQNYGSNPEVTYLLDSREIYFVPIVNPDGLVYNETTDPGGGGMWRKNRRDNGGGCYGVDLNRNYPYMWGAPGSIGDSCVATYRGPFAGSEPEVQAMMSLINAHQFVTHQTFHSFGGFTLYPWGYTPDPTPDAHIFEHMAGLMTRHNHYEPGQACTTLYPVVGCAHDWAYGAQGEHGKIFSLCNELGYSYDGFWPPEERRIPIFQENLWPSIYLIRAAAAFIEASDVVVVGGDGNGRADPAESAGFSFTLANQGVTADAFGVSVRLSSDDPYIQLGEAYRDIGTIPARAGVDFTSSPFPVAVDPACPSAHLSTLNVTVREQDAPPLDYALHFVVDEPIVLFSDDFESGIAAWTTTGTWNTTNSTSHSPTQSLTDSPGDDYVDDTQYSATSTMGVPATHLSFWHKYEIEEGYDFGCVQASAGNGLWTTLAIYSGYNTSWTQVELPLNNWAGQSVQIRFLLLADELFTEDGWYIDDVFLEGPDRSNQTPPPPVLISPAPGEEVNTDPVLTVANSTDPDGMDPLTYGFRIHADSMCTNLAAYVDSVPEGVGQTAWTPSSLADGTYWWRAYAADSKEWGLLGETRRFKKSVVAILVKRFDAKWAGSTIRLTWDVSADEAIAGFNIYRRDESKGYEKLINRLGLIPEGDRSYDDMNFEAGHTYYYTLGAVKADGSEVRSHEVDVEVLAYEFALRQNYPNPFNPTTTISFTLPQEAMTNLSILNLEGKLIKTLVNEVLPEGYREIVWDGKDAKGNPASSGVYFYRLKAGNKALTRKMVLLR
ncbi:MAG: T9SS type A sorting domain-containing protein [Candidatus Latescibacteria bacterium]|nr:T9SS type A sorting domain-containing protein [Candidatus Latescibacterota bacterium]NIO57269.1 T9SS type A sorting domain-containing protein [Candidatus Latescibacterota bacterium]